MPIEKAAAPPIEWLDADFGDTALTVREFPDGMFTITIDDGARLLVTGAQMQEIVGGFLRLGKEKGWT